MLNVLTPGTLVRADRDPVGALSVYALPWIVVHDDGSWDTSNLARIKNADIREIVGPAIIIAVAVGQLHTCGVLKDSHAEYVLSPDGAGWVIQGSMLKVVL